MAKDAKGKISDKKLKYMTERQVSTAYLGGRITKGQHNRRMHEIGTRRHAQDMRKHPLRRFY